MVFLVARKAAVEPAGETLSAGSLAAGGQTRGEAAGRQLSHVRDLAGLDTLRQGDPGRWLEYRSTRLEAPASPVRGEDLERLAACRCYFARGDDSDTGERLECDPLTRERRTSRRSRSWA